LPTTIILVRSGETPWHQQGRLLGRRDIGITDVGKEQAQRALGYLGELEINELLASPLARAVQTAEVFAGHHHIGVGRDPRLLDLEVGKWEGSPWDDLTRHNEFHDFFAGETEGFPDGENLDGARRRAVSSIEQAAADNPHNANIVVVTHSFIVRLILVHYLGMPTGAFVRLQVRPGSLSVLRFISEMQQPQVLGVNLAVPLEALVASGY
jgi:broad specificity phosphatase PhoE